MTGDKLNQIDDASILVVCDNFWIGGRETFIETNARLLRSHGVSKISLVANSIGNPRANKIFNHCIETGGDDALISADKWQEIDQLVRSMQPDLVWAQHYGLSTALLIASRYRLKLHITIHGPPLSQGAYSPDQAWAFVKAVYAGASFSCVSEEIKQQLNPLSAEINIIGILHNKATLPTVKQPQSQDQSVVSFVMAARQSKLQHLRQGLLLLAAFNRAGHSGKLHIYTGTNSRVSVALNGSSQWHRRFRLFGRKWIFTHPQALRVLPAVQIFPMTEDIDSRIRHCDVVLGMGRVVLEALAHMKPAILIGYDSVIGLVTTDNFPRFQATNFSGREQRSSSNQQIVSATMGSINSITEKQRLRNMVDIERSWSTLAGVLRGAYSANSIAGLSADELSLLEQLVKRDQRSIDMLPQQKSSLTEVESVMYNRLLTAPLHS